MTIFRDSRFEPYSIYQLPHKSGKLVETLPPIKINRTIPYGTISHIIREGDRIDLLAYQYYGDSIPTIWWIIANANPQIEDLHNLEVGKRLLIPPRSFVRSVLDGLA